MPKPQEISINQAIDKWLTAHYQWQLKLNGSLSRLCDTEEELVIMTSPKLMRRSEFIWFMNWYEYMHSKHENGDPSDYDRPPFRVGVCFN